MTSKKEVSRDEQDWGDCNTTSIDEPAPSLSEQKFICHRMFVLAYLMITLIVFGYVSQQAEHLSGLEQSSYWTGGVLCYLALMACGLCLHSIAIFDLTVNHYTKD